MRTSAAVLLMLLLSAAVAPAQKTAESVDPKAREAYIQLHDQLVGWVRSDILPVARTWKTRLDEAMDRSDLEKLNALRARAAALNARRMEYTKAMADAWHAEDYDALKASRQQLKALLPEGLMLLEELRPLGLKYRSTLESIGADAKPIMEEWKKEGIQRYQNWMVSNREAIGNVPFPKGAGVGHMGWLAKFGPEQRKKMAAALFMLWDGGDLAGQLVPQGSLGMPALD
jgi:hypothetical protein